jgi:hypothetical protein
MPQNSWNYLIFFGFGLVSYFLSVLSWYVLKYCVIWLSARSKLAWESARFVELGDAERLRFRLNGILKSLEGALSHLDRGESIYGSGSLHAARRTLLKLLEDLKEDGQEDKE